MDYSIKERVLGSTGTQDEVPKFKGFVLILMGGRESAHYKINLIKSLMSIAPGRGLLLKNQ